MLTFEDMPQEMFLKIARYLTIKDLIQLQRANKLMSFRTRAYLCERVGVQNWQEFTEGMNSISKDPRDPSLQAMEGRRPRPVVRDRLRFTKTARRDA